MDILFGSLCLKIGLLGQREYSVWPFFFFIFVGLFFLIGLKVRWFFSRSLILLNFMMFFMLLFSCRWHTFLLILWCSLCLPLYIRINFNKYDSHFYLGFFYSVLKAFITNPLIFQIVKLELREIIGFPPWLYSSLDC